MTNSHQTFKKSYQTLGRPEVTDRDINDQYMKEAPDNLSPPSLANAEAAIKDGQKAEDMLNDEKHMRQNRGEIKKHTSGRFGALVDAEEGGVPDRESVDIVDSRGVLKDNAGGKPVRHDVETSLLE